MKRALAAGVVVGERYRLGAKLGEGAMGAVWSAEHLHTRRKVALKFLKGATEEARSRFLREARAASAARHANVVEVIDLLELDDALVMVMELLEGETLATRLARRVKLGVEDVAWIVGAGIDALEAVHALGIIHRDLKPENIFLELRPGETAPRVKVLDFGVAKLTAREGAAAESQGAGLTNTESFLGTPYYMSPEQVFGEKDIDARADIWSLGVIVYECLSGERPTQAENVGQVMKRITTADLVPIARVASDVPEDVADIVAAMLSRDRAARPTLATVARVLTAHRAGPPSMESGAAPANGAHSSAKPVVLGSARGRTTRFGAIAFAIAALAGVGALAMNGAHRGALATGLPDIDAEPVLDAAIDVVPPEPVAQPSISAVPVASAPVAAERRRVHNVDASAPTLDAGPRQPSYDDIHSL